MHLEGQSFVSLLANPKAPHKTAAYRQCPRAVEGKQVMGYTLRNDRYRFTIWGERGTELYDHQTDPGETVNVAGRAENAKLVGELRAQLLAALPKAGAPQTGAAPDEGAESN